MEHIGLHEAKTHLSELIANVSDGKEYIITKRGIPVARLCPTDTPNREAAKNAVKRIKDLRKTISLGNVTIKELIEDGRR